MPARRMSMQLATIIEASPPPRSPRNARRMSLGVNIPVDQRPPRRTLLEDATNISVGQPGPKTSEPQVNPLAFIFNTPVKPLARRQSLGAVSIPKPLVLHKPLSRRQSMPCRAQEMRDTRATASHSTTERPPRRKLPVANVESNVPSYARPTAASLRRRKTP